MNRYVKPTSILDESLRAENIVHFYMHSHIRYTLCVYEFIALFPCQAKSILKRKNKEDIHPSIILEYIQQTMQIHFDK